MIRVTDSIEVSVVIPTYNRKERLNDTLESLFHQTIPKDQYEIIVVDDGSSDGTEEMVQKLMEDSICHLRYFKQKNQGQAAARNLGIKNAVAGIIGFTDDDCTASPEWVETAATYFKGNPGIGGLAGRTTPIEKPSPRFLKKVRTTYATNPLGPYPTCNVFYSREALLRISGFDPRLRTMYEDYDLTWRIRKEGFKIDFSDDLISCHAVDYISYFSQLKSMKKNEYAALYFKKHPEIKKKLALGFITNKKHIYPFFTLFTLILLFTSHIILAGVFFLLTLLSYSWVYVFKDWNVEKYPLRLLSFPTRIIPDTVRMYYTVKGAVKFRCLIL